MVHIKAHKHAESKYIYIWPFREIGTYIVHSPHQMIQIMSDSPLTRAQAVVRANLRFIKSLGNPSDAMQSHFKHGCQIIPIASLVFALQL